MSLRWPPRKQAELAARRKYEGPNRRRKWEYLCNGCMRYHAGKDIEVDHIVPAGSLKSFDDLPGFCERLFAEPGGFRVLCKTCHNKRKAK